MNCVLVPAMCMGLEYMWQDTFMHFVTREIITFAKENLSGQRIVGSQNLYDTIYIVISNFFGRVKLSEICYKQLNARRGFCLF